MSVSRTTTGVFAIAPTPFHDDGALDLASIDSLVAFYRRAGVDGLTVLGLLGEAPELTAEESRDVVRRFVTAAGDLPVIVGVSAPGLRPIARLAEDAVTAGAAGVMIGPKPGLRTDDQIVSWFAGACAAVGASTPVVVQDFPLNSGVQIGTGVLARVFAENDNAAILKHEDWPGLDKITTLREMAGSGAMPDISILAGFGGGFLDCEMRRGASGAMTGYAFPEMLVEVVRAGLAGEFDRMQQVFDTHLPYLRYEQQPGVGLAVRKYVLHRRGVITSTARRSPGGPLSKQSRAEVDRLLERIELSVVA